MTTAQPIKLSDIEKLTAAYAAAHDALAGQAAIINAETAALVRREMPAIRRVIDNVNACYVQLHDAIESSPTLFTKPRTRALSGVRVGWRTGRATTDIPDEAETIRRIRSQLPEEQACLLISVREQVDKRTVADLTAADLKRLRIYVTPGGESVVIKRTDSAVDKIVAALLKDAERIEEEAA